MPKIISKEAIITSVSYLLLPFDWLYQRGKGNNLAMIHLGRSGSTVLGDMLNQHNRIRWTGEIYGKYIRRDPDNFYKMLPKKREWLLYQSLEKDRRGTVKKFYGYEIKFYHLHFMGESFSNYVQTVSKMGVKKFIVLERLNYLKVIISSLVALQNGLWHIKEETSPSLTRVSVDVDDLWTDGESKTLMGFLDGYAHSFREARNTLKDTNTLYLNYEEDILQDPGIAYTKVCAFLKLPPKAPKTNYYRTNRYKLQDIIVNFDELKYYLKGSQYEWMLYE
ncbi:MAG: hypothetical protein HEP71_12280 [Roseivirga sp.]|nr:hypothetical protein [Roseivirga sp.]